MNKYFEEEEVNEYFSEKGKGISHGKERQDDLVFDEKRYKKSNFKVEIIEYEIKD